MNSFPVFRFHSYLTRGVVGLGLLTPCGLNAQGFEGLIQQLTGSAVEKEIRGSSADQVASETADPTKPLPSVPIPSSVEILSSQQEDSDFKPQENIKTNGVVVQGLDKITGRVFITQAPLNQEIGFGSLRIVVHHCEKAPAESREESMAFVTISETKGPFPAQELFSGWMFSASPALSSFDHPLYDVWVKECKVLPPKTR